MDINKYLSKISDLTDTAQIIIIATVCIIAIIIALTINHIIKTNNTIVRMVLLTIFFPILLLAKILGINTRRYKKQ